MGLGQKTFTGELQSARPMRVEDEYRWAKRWLELANHISSWSKDRSTKVGCVVVGDANQVLALGYNGFPRGVNDHADERHERPLKYKWTEHAERNAIYNAARTGTNLTDSTIYVPWFPCTDCARGIVQSGIAEVVTVNPWEYRRDFMDRWAEDFDISYGILFEAKVRIRYID